MMVKALPFACLLAVALGAVPMDMRGPGDEECHASVVNTCDMSSTHCVQIKYYLAPWEYTDSTDDKAREKGVVCMCKRGYSPDPENEVRGGLYTSEFLTRSDTLFSSLSFILAPIINQLIRRWAAASALRTRTAMRVT